MTEPREPEAIPDVRNDPVPEPVRETPLPGDAGEDDGSTVEHREGE